jgi:hypothetical protein
MLIMKTVLNHFVALFPEKIYLYQILEQDTELFTIYVYIYMCRHIGTSEISLGVRGRVIKVVDLKTAAGSSCASVFRFFYVRKLSSCM